MSPTPARRTGRRPFLQGKEALRFAVMLVLLIVVGALLGGTLEVFYSGASSSEKKEIPDREVEVPIPPVNHELLAKVKDETDRQKLDAEAEAYEHLLECARYIVPGTLRAMALGDSPTTVRELRQNPVRYRGRPVAFEGSVHELLPAVPIPGMRGYKKTEGFLETASGDHVFFAVIAEVPKEIRPGSFARVEGLFFKLRNFYFPEKLTNVPHVVGYELRHSYGDFKPVTELDPEILATIHDSDPKPGDVPQQPLYHLASFVKNRKVTEEWKRSVPVLGYDDIKSMVTADGRVPRGKDFRVLGALYDVQIKLAEPNPLGIEFWTRAWVKHRDCDAIQVNIPGRVRGGWRTGDFVVFYGAFMKRHWYEAGFVEGTQQRVEKIVPLFIADQLYRWELVDNPANVWIKAALTGVTLLLIGVVSLLVIRDSRSDQEVRERILQRRRRRQARAR